MKNLITAAKQLVEYIENNATGIMSKEWMDGNNDANVHDEWRTLQLHKLTGNLKESVDAITELPDVMKARKLIRDCFFELIEEPAKQTKQP